MSNPFDFLDPVQPQAQAGATANPFDFLDPAPTSLPNPAPLPPPRPSAEEQTAMELANAPLPPSRPRDLLEQGPGVTNELPTETLPEQLDITGKPYTPLRETLRLQDPGALMKGDNRSALTLEEQAQEVKGRLESADTRVQEAQDRFAAAKQQFDTINGRIGSATPRRGSQTANQLLVAQDAMKREEMNLANATAEKQAVLQAAPPTLNPIASAARAGLESAATIPVDAAAGAARVVDWSTSYPGSKDWHTADAIRGVSDRIGNAIVQDPARAGEFLEQLGQGAGSSIGFMMGGLATKSLGLGASAGASTLGFFQNAEDKYRDASKLGKKGFDLALNYLAGGATGATEGMLGVGKLADLERVTNGGVSRFFAVVGKEAGEEAFQEATQQLLGNMQDRGLLDKNTPIEEGVGMNALIGALIGAGFAGGHHAVHELAGKLGLHGTDPNIPAPGAPQDVDVGEFLARADAANPKNPGADAFTSAPARSVLDDTRLLPAPGGQPSVDGSSNAPAPGPAAPALDPESSSAPAAPADVQPGAAPDNGTVAPAPTPDAAPVADGGPVPAGRKQSALTAKEEADLRLLLGHGLSAEEIADLNRGERVQAIKEAQAAGTEPYTGPLPGDAVSHETLPPLPENAPFGAHDLTPSAPSAPSTTTQDSTGAAQGSGPSVESLSTPLAAKPSAPTPSQDVGKTPAAAAELQAQQEQKPADNQLSAKSEPVPATLDALREKLPKDADGNPDFGRLADSVAATKGERAPWGKLTPGEKQAAWDHLNGTTAPTTTRDEGAGQAESVSKPGSAPIELNYDRGKKPLSELPTDILGTITNAIFDSPAHPDTGNVRVLMTDEERQALRDHGIEVSDSGTINGADVQKLMDERAQHVSGKKPKTPTAIQEAGEGLNALFGGKKAGPAQGAESDRPNSGVASTGTSETAPNDNHTAPAKKPKVRVHHARRQREPKTALEHIMAAGGLAPDAELNARDLHRHYRPGWGRLVRKQGGMHLDKARELLTERGYLQPHQTIDDALNLIEDEANGRKAKTLAEQNYDDTPEQDPEEAHREASDAIVEYLSEIGLPHDQIEDEALSLAAELVLTGSDLAEAYADAVRKLEQRDPEVASEMEAHDIPFDPEEDSSFEPDPTLNDWLADSGPGAHPQAQGGASEAGRPAGGTESSQAGERPAADRPGSAQNEVDDGPARPERESAVGESTKRDPESLTGTAKALADGERQFGPIRVEITESYKIEGEQHYHAEFFLGDESLTNFGSGTGGLEHWLKLTVGPYVDALVLRQVELETQRKVGWPKYDGLKARERHKLADLETTAFYAAMRAHASSRDELARRKELHGAFAETYAAELRKHLAETGQAETETGADGKPQTLIPGVKPVTDGEKLGAKADKPLTAKKPQKDLQNDGLFGDGHTQGDLLDAPKLSPYEQGKADFKAGKNSTPPRSLGGDLKALEQWTKGWHEANAAEPVESIEVDKRLAKLKDQLVVFASGMSRIKDLAAGGWTVGGLGSRGIGVEINELTLPAMKALAKAIVVHQAQVFVDSGAFGIFRKNLRDAAAAKKEAEDLFGEEKPAHWQALDFDVIMKRYDKLREFIGEQYDEEGEPDYPQPLMVMPDIVGDQAGSLDLLEQHAREIKIDIDFSRKVIVPIQKGALTMAQAYEQAVATLGTDKFIVGVPSNAAAMSDEDLRAFLTDAKPRGLHFLGAAAKGKLDAKLQVIAETGIELEHLSADGNILRGSLYGRDMGDKSRPEAISETLGDKSPELFDGDLVGHFAERLTSGSLKNIAEARKIAKEYGVTDVKAVEETLELAIVTAARRIVAKQHLTPEDKFDRLAALYAKQPNLATRTSTSMLNQAYSTPIPLAYVASRLAGITKNTTVLEPTAGNGALLIEANPKNAFVNEINDDRAANLRKQGFTVSQNDASERSNGTTFVDVVIENPPFGTVKDDIGESTVFDLTDIQKGYKTKEIDHAIALRSLENLEDDGRAVLIIGSVNPQKDRSEGYRGKAKNEFFLTLLKNYNVVDHFTVDGSLYKKQGAGWPVDVIVIHGRGASNLEHPAKTVPPVLSSWDEVKAKLNGVQQSEAGGSSEIAGDAGGSGRGGPDGDVAGPRDGNGGSGSLAVQPESGQSEGVRQDGDTGQPGSDTGRAGAGKRGQRGDAAGPDRGTQPALAPDAAIDAAIDELFGEEPTATPSSRVDTLNPGAVRTTKMRIDDALDWATGRNGTPKDPARAKRDIDKALEFLNEDVNTHGQAALDALGPENVANLKKAAKAAGVEIKIPKAPKPKAAKVAATEFAAGVKEAGEGLMNLFGPGSGTKMSAGLTFDNETYEKAKPFFKRAFEHFKNAASSVMDMARELVRYMRDVMGATREVVQSMKPYLARFIEQVQDGSLFREEAKSQETGAEPIRDLTETEGQVTYNPRSKIFGLGTLVPANMRTATENALEDLENRVGNLETYVSKELGYEQDAEGPYFMRDGQKERPFAAEQVDALALAIDNMNKGAALIIGDQTGIGKGRVNAGIIRYALEKKAHPIFVTKDNGLYKDIYRDLTDIGIQEYLGREPKFLMTDANQSFPLDENGRMVLKSASVSKHNALLMDLAGAGSLGEYDIVLTSYSQMQTVNGARTDRMRFLEAIGPNAIMALDESHNAGGQANKRDDYEAKHAKWEKARAKAIRAGKPFNRPAPEQGVPDRAGFSRHMIDLAKAAFYSSATYAKRPDVMDLYRKTDMRLAVKDISELAQAIQAGGIPMQQVVASMLAQAGQYVRRERSFAGVSYDPAVVPVDEEVYDNFSSALALIQDFAKKVAAATADIDAELTGSGESVGHDNATGDAGASSLNFTSIMHNLINNMLLAINAKPAADAAIEAVKRGEKPLIAVAQTAESFLSAYADENDLKVGDAIDLDMGKMLERYLERSRWITIRQPFMEAGDEAEKVRLTDEQLGEAGMAAWEAAKEHLRSTDFSALPASPIDYIKSELKKAGVRVGEITGRTLTIEYLNGKQKLVNRAGSERSTAGKTETIKQFNSAGLDALILNQSGSTGLSMHASSKFKDQSKRIMIIAQPEQNIDTHFQMLGRIHRTGQVRLPAYVQLIPDVPAAKRPAAILMKKMASLNANTTASRKSALTTDNVPDFMNEFGDRVAANILRDDPELADTLDINPPRTDGGASALDGAMRKMTGRIPLLRIDPQKELYERIESEYAFMLEQMEAEGRNTLEAKTLELDAKPVRSAEVEAAEGPSPFQQAVTLTEYDIKRQGKPYTIEELGEDLAKGMGIERSVLPADMANAIQQAEERGRRIVASMTEEAQERWTAFRDRFLARITDETKIEPQRTRLDGIANDHAALTEYLFPGNRIRLKYDDQESITGLVLKVTPAGEKATNPLAPGQWKVKIAVPSGERSREYPFTKFVIGKEPENGEIALEQAGWAEPIEATVKLFELAATQKDRETRVIATGNLLKAFTSAARGGSIVNFRTHDGKIVPGIMLRQNRGRSLEEAVGNVRSEISGPALEKALRENVGTPYTTQDGFLTLTNNGYGRVMLSANKARDKGGRYTLNRGVIAAVGEDFYSRGGHMRADARIEKLPAVLAALKDAGATFTQAADLNITEHPPTDGADYATLGRKGDGGGLYSSVEKAVEGAKTNKATGQQWLATIRNAQGVKADELAWLGLEDWLADNRTTPLTRADVLAFVRENQVTLEHVTKQGTSELAIQEKARELREAELNEAVEKLEESAGLPSYDYFVFEDENGGWDYSINDERAWHDYETADEAEAAAQAEVDRRDFVARDELRYEASRNLQSWSYYEDMAQNYFEEEAPSRVRYNNYKSPGDEASYREHLLTLPYRPRMKPLTFSVHKQNVEGARLPWKVRNDVSGNTVIATATQFEADNLARLYNEESEREGIEEDDGSVKAYKSGHWEEKNVLAHFRTTERTVNGKKTLFIEEIQSDWHQDGRKRGYDGDTPALQKAVDDARAEEHRVRDLYWTSTDLSPEAEALKIQYREAQENTLQAEAALFKARGKTVPDAPFKTTWHELALKRILKMAVDEGYDQVAWTHGDEQNQRYGLEKHFSALELMNPPNGTRLLQAYDFNGKTVLSERVHTDEDLAAMIGEDLAKRLLAAPVERTSMPTRTLKGNDLRTGGEGMRGFYDKILPSAADKIGKRFGAKTARFGGRRASASGESRLSDELVHVLPITNDMKLGVTVDGFPLFDARGRQVSPEQQLAIRNEVISAIHAAIVGEHAGLEFPDRIVITDAVGARNSGAAEGQKEALAVYANHIIKVAAKGEWSNIFHEAAHVFQRLGAYTKQELALLERERPRNRKIVQRVYNITAEQAAAMPDYEIDAYAAEDFAYHAYRQNPAGMKGYHIGLRRAWQRLLQMVRRIMNAFRGLGYQISEDVFAAQMRGEMKDRLDARARGEDVAGYGYGRSWDADRARYAAENPESRDDYATRRRGTFTDETIADIKRENAAAGYNPTPKPGTPASFDTPGKTVLDHVKEEGQDFFRFQEKLQSAIEAARGAPIIDPQNAYQAQSLFPGKRDEALEDFKHDMVDPLVKAIHDAKVTTDEVGVYLIAKHAAERNQLMAERDPKRFGVDGGSGLADKAADNFILRFRAEGKEPALERIAQMVYAITAFDRENRYNNGLISDETRDHWENLFPSGRYVPLTGSAERDEEHTATHYGRGFDIRGREAKVALGRESLSDNPLPATLYAAMEGIVRVEKNRVGKTLLRLAKANPNDDVWHIIRNPTKDILVENPKTGLMEKRTVPDNLAQQKDNVLGVKVGGVPWFVELKDPSLAMAFKRMGVSEFGPVAQKLASIMRLYSSLQTGRNPEFFIRNGMRDIQEAIAYATSFSSAFGARVAKNAVPALIAAFRKSFGFSAGATWDKIYDEWRHDGGRISGYAFHDVESIHKQVQQELNDLKAGVIKKFSKGLWRMLLKLIDGLNEAVESATRLSVYKAARESGFSRDKSGFHSRNATINFTKKGRRTPWLNLTWMFFNASTQGSFNHAAMLARSNKMRLAWVGLLGLGYVMNLLGRSWGDDDEENRRPYDEIADFVKRRNFIFPYGVKKDTSGNQRLQYIQIPMMFGFNIPFYVGGQIADVVGGRVTPFKAAINSVGAIADGFNPLGSGNPLQMITPTLLRPFEELYTNRDWRDRPIYPEDQRWNEGLPNSSQPTNSTTNPAATRFTQGLNQLTGGTKYEPGAIDLYPGAVQYGVEWLGGGLGRFATNSIHTALDGWETPMERLPLLRQFLGETNGAGESQRYYELKRGVQESKNRYTNAKKAVAANPDDEAAHQALEKEADALGVSPNPSKKTKWKGSATDAFTSADDEIKELRGDRQTIQNDSSLTTLEKLRKTQDIDGQIQTIMRNARGEYKSKTAR